MVPRDALECKFFGPKAMEKACNAARDEAHSTHSGALNGLCIADKDLKGLVITMVRVDVFHNDVEQALRRLKKLMNREGLFRELRQRRYNEKPFEKRARLQREGVRRSKKNENKRNYDM
jgi:small subunit ribosomal protein S21